ncbi:MAG: hypothetical protein ABIH69_03640 [bacterium]
MKSYVAIKLKTIIIVFIIIFFVCLSVSRLSLNSLFEIKSFYWQLCVEPRMDDAITMAMDNLIKDKVSKAITLHVAGKKYRPIETYAISCFEPGTFKGKLENGYADDSIHISEFLEGRVAISYGRADIFGVELKKGFDFVVKPQVYPEHSWEVLKTKGLNDKEFFLPDKLSRAVLFSIIEEKNVTKRRYKVLWVVDYKEDERMGQKVVNFHG